jgi:glc operon protein GlcG
MLKATATVVALLAGVLLVRDGAAGAQTPAGAAKAGAGEPAVTMMPVPPVRYFSKQDVEATFNHQKSSETLFDSDYGSESFRVKASSRTKLLDAEIHMEWTDVIYVTRGSATLVTGGRLSNDTTPKTFPDGRPFTETKMGSSIIGGESRRIGVGDVVVIPAGTPHWFKDIDGPFWFFNVKTR